MQYCVYILGLATSLITIVNAKMNTNWNDDTGKFSPENKADLEMSFFHNLRHMIWDNHMKIQDLKSICKKHYLLRVAAMIDKTYRVEHGWDIDRDCWPDLVGTNGFEVINLSHIKLPYKKDIEADLLFCSCLSTNTTTYVDTHRDRFYLTQLMSSDSRDDPKNTKKGYYQLNILEENEEAIELGVSAYWNI